MYYNSTKMMMMNYIYKVGNGNENVWGLYFFFTAVHLGYKNLGKISNGLYHGSI